MHALVAEALAGSAPAVARLISLIESGDPEGAVVLKELHPRAGRAYVIGVTGPPGAGKSSLVDASTRLLRKQGKTVGVVAVDPTSPFTGGALLGDRIRMQDHATDPGVFIRSMATRGSLGGLAPTTADVVRVLDATGFDLIFLETVGTGQAEVDVVSVADSVVIVLVPGMGDTVQTMKAGIMEIGEIFVVNKADQGDPDRTVAEIRMMLQLNPHPTGWDIPVVKTVATSGQGVEEVLAALDAHRRYLSANGALERRRKARRREEILRIMEAQMRTRARELATRSGRLEQLADRVYAGELDPYTAAAELMRKA